MKTGEYICKACIVFPQKGDFTFGSPILIDANSVLPSYGLSNGGIVDWKEYPLRAGLVENGIKDGIQPTVTSKEFCTVTGLWEILGTNVRVWLESGCAFPEQYKNFIWAKNNDLL